MGNTSNTDKQVETLINRIKKLTTVKRRLSACQLTAYAQCFSTPENLRQRGENVENDLDIIKKNINEIVDKLFARISRFSKYDRGHTQLRLESK